MPEIYRVKGRLTRRDFLKISSITAAGVVAGCATNPVTGESQLMLVSPQEEINLDRKNSPHQFSADYGTTTDPGLNAYINQTGVKIASLSHRPNMPYSFRAVSATYANAYAFPGGSIATTRGMLVSLENEAELSALLGHEVGHVNARHTAARMSKGLLAQIAVAGLAIYVSTKDDKWAPLAAGLGAIGTGILLAKYSRDDERQSDTLGMDYMTRAGHNPKGMVGLMDHLRSLNKRKPSALDMMFASHPMSDERYQTALARSSGQYKSAHNLPVDRERFMDNTTRLRALKPAIEKMQNGEKLMMKKKFKEAEGEYAAALKLAPDDYAGLLMMAKCQLAQNKNGQAKIYAERARKVNPNEPQALHVAGMAKMGKREFALAYRDFAGYEQRLPGNPNTIFLKAQSLEGMGRRKQASQEYYRYLQKDNQSSQAQHAFNRLVKWGYINPKK